MDKANVAIIGCGIAGEICALKLLKEGFTVNIIDKSTVIGEQNETKIDITEDAGLENIFNELNIKNLTKSNKSRWFSPNNSFSFESKISDIFVKRGSEKDSLDTILSGKIKSFNCDICTNAKFEDFNIRNGTINSMKIREKNQIKEIKAKFFVGADGSPSLTTKKLQLDNSIKTGHEIIGYGLMSYDLKIPKKETHIFFDSEMVPGGYFFIGKMDNGLGVASIVSTKHHVQKPLKEYFNIFVKNNKIISDILSDFESLNYFYGSCNTGILENHTYSNFCAVGDAAYVMSPIFGYGVRPAIISGFLAAKEIINNFEQEKNDLTHYEFSLKKHLLFNEKQTHFFREVFDKLDNNDFNFLVESVSYLHNKVHLDEILDNPQKCLSLLPNIFLRKPCPCCKLGLKILQKKITSSF